MKNLLLSLVCILMWGACVRKGAGHYTLGHQTRTTIAYHTTAELPKIYWEADSNLFQNFGIPDTVGQKEITAPWFSFFDPNLKYIISTRQPSPTATAMIWLQPKQFTNDSAFSIFQKHINETIEKERLLFCDFLDSAKTLILCKTIRAKRFKTYPNIETPSYYTKKQAQWKEDKQIRHNTYILHYKNGIWDYAYYHINYLALEPKFIFNIQLAKDKKCIWGMYEFSKKSKQYRFSINSIAF